MEDLGPLGVAGPLPDNSASLDGVFAFFTGLLKPGRFQGSPSGKGGLELYLTNSCKTRRHKSCQSKT